MTSGRTIFAIVISALSLAACTSAQTPEQMDARLREATAKAIAGITADQVVISNAVDGAAKVTWQATANGKTYDCDADELIRLPACRQAA